jgi:RNA polymerase-binding transcription factor DksA
MSGYGGPDDEALRAMIRVEEQVALARSMLPSGPGSSTCHGCGQLIDERRRKIFPGTQHCVKCSEANAVWPKYKEPWAT